MNVKGIIVGTPARYQEVLDMMEESWAEQANSYSASDPPLKPPIVVLRNVEEALKSFGSWGSVREITSPAAPFAVWRVKVQERIEDVQAMEAAEARKALEDSLTNVLDAQ